MSAQEGDARLLLGMQALLTVGVAFVYLIAAGRFPAQSALFGGSCGLLHTWLLGRRVRTATAIAKASPGREVISLYFGAVQRFALLLALFAVGMGWLGLRPLPLLIAFGVTQSAFFLSITWAAKYRQTTETTSRKMNSKARSNSG